MFKNLWVWQKLVLLGVLFLIPFALVTSKMVSSKNHDVVDFAKNEVLGVDYYKPLLVLLKDLQLHNAQSAAWLNSDASFLRMGSRRRALISRMTTSRPWMRPASNWPARWRPREKMPWRNGKPFRTSGAPCGQNATNCSRPDSRFLSAGESLQRSTRRRLTTRSR